MTPPLAGLDFVEDSVIYKDYLGSMIDWLVFRKSITVAPNSRKYDFNLYQL